MQPHGPISPATDDVTDVGDLVRALLPYASLTELALKTVEFWGRTAGVEWCELEVPESLPAHTLRTRWSAEAEAAVVPEISSAAREINTLFSVRDGTAVGRLLFPETAHPVPHRQELLDATARILQTAQTEKRRLWNRKLESLAEFAAGAGHEINNPLGSIIGRTAQLLDGESDPERRRLLRLIGGQAYRIRDMIGDTMLFARPPAMSPEWGPFSAILNDVLHGLREPIADKQLVIRRPREDSLEVWADPVQIRVVFSELLRNAIEASPANSTINITAVGEHPDPRSGVLWTIENPSPPLTEAEQEHAFDPFFSGRQAGRGLGFGLSKCWRIITLHGGEITLTHHEGTTRVQGRLPGPDPNT